MAAEPSQSTVTRTTPRGRYESAVWDADFARAAGRRQGAREYEAFTPDPIGEYEPPLSSSAFALAERAGSAVRGLNAKEPLLAPLEGLARQLLRSEALASSRIEGLRISHRKLAEADAEDTLGTHRALEVLGNMRAMEEGIAIGDQADVITPTDIQAIHRALAVVPPLDRIAGKFREEQGWIGGATPVDAEYVGPPYQRVKPLVADLCDFMNRDDLSPIVQAGIAHAQFELIHPFGDGNGRVGRCLIHLLFRRRGLAPRYVPPVSLVLGANKDTYIAGLQGFATGGVEDWVEQFARCTDLASRMAEEFSERVTNLQSEWLEKLGPIRKDSTAIPILKNLPTYPVITTRIVQALTGRSNRAALNGLRKLEQAEILTRHSNRRKGDSWEAKALFALLNDFEQEVRMP